MSNKVTKQIVLYLANGRQVRAYFEDYPWADYPTYVTMHCKLFNRIGVDVVRYVEVVPMPVSPRNPQP